MTSDPQPTGAAAVPSYAGFRLIALVVVLLLSMGTVTSLRGCHGDGCIGSLLYGGGAAALVLGIQIFVLIPVDAVRRSRGGEPWALSAALWAAASIAAFAVPMHFIGP